MNNSKLSPDTKVIITVLLLIFFFPVGIFLLWYWNIGKLWSKILISILTAVVALSISFGVFVLLMLPVRYVTSSEGGDIISKNSGPKFSYSILKDNPKPCSELPDNTKVKEVFNQNRGLLKELILLNGDYYFTPNYPENKEKITFNDTEYSYFGSNLSVEIGVYDNCLNKADILFKVDTSKNAEAISNKLGKDFFGIPYRIYQI
ncbi:MAG: hypothetical protein WCK98_00995 [bacterium]